MLNPYLIKEYGEESTIFFDKFVERIGEERARLCYVHDTGIMVEYGDVTLPEIIYVCSDDKDVCWEVLKACGQTCAEINADANRRNKGESGTMCLQRKGGIVKKGEVQVWV